ncbi:MAG: response regulator transcription factor, partial [Microbacterium sp.]
KDELPLATVEHDVLAAWLAHAEGRVAAARSLLTRALELASEHGIVSVFMWAGPEVIRLVEILPLRPTPFRAQVLECAREHLRASPDAALSEPLTDRERELLAYLPTRLTNAELAARFFVSVNTIKTHMAHIYRKLDAANRSAAVARATELGLL